MILTQLFYVRPGHEAEYREFEDAVIGGSLEAPYELQLVQFANDDGLAAYLADDDRQRVLHLKNASMREVWVARSPD